MASTKLTLACAIAGLRPVLLPPVKPPRRSGILGRPAGSQDSYQRKRRTWREKFEMEAALMRERFGDVEEYEMERYGIPRKPAGQDSARLTSSEQRQLGCPSGSSTPNAG